MANCVNINSKEFKTLVAQSNMNPLVLAAKISLWQDTFGVEKFPTFEELFEKSTEVETDSLDIPNQVNYSLKAINILNSDKAKQIFDKGQKNNWSLDKILTELQIPKKQKQLILDSDKTDREDIITDLLANYSYAIEINTAKEKVSPTQKIVDNNDFYVEGYNPEYISNYEGQNYGYVVSVEQDPENLISLNKWFKEEKEALVYKNLHEGSIMKKIEKSLFTPTQYYSSLTVPGGTNYTEQEIATPAITPSIKGHATFATDKGIGWFRSDEQASEYIEDEMETIPGISATKGLEGSKTRRILEVQSDLFQKGRGKSDLIGTSKVTDTKEWMNLEIELSNKFTNGEITEDEYKERLKQFEDNFENNKNKNQFLQLLNKDNNWVTFFIKSIIQDSAKKGYEKVLFPLGETIAKIEQYGEAAKMYAKLLAKKQRGEKLTVQEEDAAKEYEELNQKAVIDFYENTVTNIIKKQGYNSVLITDEYGNTWNEINVEDKSLEIEMDSLDIPMTYVNTKVVEELNSQIDPRDAAEVKEKIGDVVNMLLQNQDTFYSKRIIENYGQNKEILKEVLFLVNNGVDTTDSLFDTFDEAYQALKKLKLGLELQILNATYIFGRDSKGGLMKVDPAYLKQFDFSLFKLSFDNPQGPTLMISPSRTVINALAKYPTLSLKNNTFRNYYDLLLREQLDNLLLEEEVTQENYDRLMEELGDVSNQTNTEEENFVIAKSPNYKFTQEYGQTEEIEFESSFFTNPNNPQNTAQTASALLSVTRLEELGKRKTAQIAKIRNKIINLTGIEKAVKGLNKVKIKKEIAILKGIEKELEEDLNKFKKITDVEQLLTESFDKDVQNLLELLKNPSLTNLYLAKDIQRFLQRTFNISIKTDLDEKGVPKDMNKSTIFVLDNENQAYPVELESLLQNMRKQLDTVTREIYKAENKAFISLLEKQQPLLSELYPGLTNEEIRARLLERINYNAIDELGNRFLPRGRTMEEADPIGQLERLEYVTEESRASLEVAPIRAKLESMKEVVSKKLIEMGKIAINGSPDFHSMFFTKKSDGKIDYVTRFSERWEIEIKGIYKNFYKEISKIMQNSNLSKEAIRQARERVSNDKFSSLKAIADFIDFRYLKEIYEDTDLSEDFSNSFIDDGGVYRENLIKRIGITAYNDLVDKQLLNLYRFEEQKKKFIENELSEREVDTFEELSLDEQSFLKAVINAKNPLYFIENFKNKGTNDVGYFKGSSTYALKSEINNNVFIPKDQAYYNPQYDEISQDPLLYDFLNTLKEAQRYVTESGVSTTPESVFFMARKAKEMYMNKHIFTRPFYRAYHNLTDGSILNFIRSFFSDREQRINENSSIYFYNNNVSSSLFERVQEIAEIDLVKISTILKLTAPLAFKEKNQQFSIGKSQLEELQAIADVLEVSPTFLKEIAEKRYVDFTDSIATVLKSSGNTIRQLVDKAYEGETTSLAAVQKDKQLKFALAMKEALYVSDLVSIFQNKALEEQTYDIVTMQKLALSMAADYKAKTYTKDLMESLTVDLGKVSYARGNNRGEYDNESPERQSGTANQEAFKRSVVFGKRANVWGYNFSRRLFEKDGELKKLFGTYSRNLTDADKKLFEAYADRIEVLDELEEKVLKSSLPQDKKNKLLNQFKTEKDRITDIVSEMGIDYRLSSPLNNMITSGFIAVKMFWNFKTAIVMNRFQAWIQGMAKAGRTDKEGNLISGTYRAEAFQMAYFFMSPGIFLSKIEQMRKAGLSYYNRKGGNTPQEEINKEYFEKAKQLKIMAILMETLNVVQDGTDLLAKAERPVIGKAPTFISRKIVTKGMYAQEWAEYNNQVPLILATMYELKLEDGTRVFDGTSFPIYETDSETLRLKPEYRTPENIEKYEKWLSPESLAYISKLKTDVIPRRNGDYTYSGIVGVQRTYLGRSLLALKRYSSMMIYDAWSKPQEDILSGQVKGGYLRTLAEGNSETRGQLLSVMTTNLASTVIMGGLSFGVIKSLGISAVAVLGLPVALIGATGIYGVKKTIDALRKKEANRDKSLVKNAKGFTTQTLTSLYATFIPLFQTINAMTLMLNDKSYLNEIDWTQEGKLTPQEADAFRTASIQQGIHLMLMLTYGLLIALMDSPDDDEEKETRQALAEKQKERIKESQSETALRRSLLNVVGRMQEDNSIGVNFDKEVLALTGGDKTSLFVPAVGTLEGIYHLYSGDVHGQPNSMYYGDSKASVAFRKSLIPIAIRNFDKEGWLLGLEQETEKVTKNKNKFYQAGQTDYKKHKREIPKLRAKLKIKIQSEQYPNYDEMTVREQFKVDKMIKNELDNLLPIPSRDLYDEKQQIKNLETKKHIEEAIERYN